MQQFNLPTAKGLVPLIVSTLLCGAPLSAMAWDHGQTGWSTRNSSEGPFTDGGSWLNIQWRNGSQGTWWIWRWEKFYPEYSFFCGNPESSGTNCNASINQTKSESITYTNTWEVSATSALGYITPGAKTSWSVATQYGTAFTFNYGSIVPPAYHLYSGVISLQKSIPLAPIVGRWEPTGNWAYGNCGILAPWIPGCETQYEYRWNAYVEAANWTGTWKNNHRAYVCKSKQTVDWAQDGSALPDGCSAPALPWGY